MPHRRQRYRTTSRFGLLDKCLMAAVIITTFIILFV